MRRRPIPILLALALAVGLAPAAAQALPESAVVHEAATEDELVAAAAAVNADDTGAPQAIRLTGDIAFDGPSNNELVFTRDVTLLGGGHSIDLGSWGLVAQDGATLTLGESDGSDALVIKRTGSEPRIRPLIRLGSWSGAGTLDMYDGVELTGSIVNGAQMGAAVGIDHGTFNMHGGSIHGNENRSSAGMGGAVAGRSDSAAPVVVNISGGSITENVSSNSGYSYNSPAVLVIGGTFTMSGGEIARNSAVHGETTADGKSLVAYGGGVGLLRSTGTITGGSIEGNTGSSQGGGIYAQNSTLRISGCTIDGNAASGFGGGIFLSSTPLTVRDTDITGNRTDRYGGALYAYGASEVSLGSGTRIEGNSAGYGGGLANSSTGTVTVYADALLAGNLATEGAGNDIAHYGKGALALPAHPVPESRRPYSVTGLDPVRSLREVDGWYADEPDNGWTPLGATMLDAAQPITGRTFIIAAFHAYQASYRFESATEGRQLPDEVASLLPTDDAVYGEGDTVDAVAPERDRVEADGGVWTFDGYDAASVRVDGAAPAFVGRWSWHASTPWTTLTPATPTDASGDGGAKGRDGKKAASKGLPKTGDAAWVGAAVAGVGAATVLAGVSILRPKRSRQR